ncbi:hypothetical protein ACQP1V_06330 [Microtetraspora malaysiensis]|uniref:hypothetical protein n=1 Tax=Microtetraspora malaysiensis TaxID=161358 RepID=UPI003D929610
MHAVLRNALERAAREESTPRNAAKLVKVPVPKYKVNRGLTVPQARATLKAVAEDRTYALYVLRCASASGVGNCSASVGKPSTSTARSSKSSKLSSG